MVISQETYLYLKLETKILNNEAANIQRVHTLCIALTYKYFFTLKTQNYDKIITNEIKPMD